MNEQYRPRGMPKGIEFPLGREDGKKPVGRDAEDLTVDDIERQLRELGMVRNSKSILSRRGFLLGATAVNAAALTGGGALMYKSFQYEDSLIAKLLRDAEDEEYSFDELVVEAKRYLKENYGMPLAVGPDKDNEQILGDKATPLEAYRISLRTLLGEVSRYPPEMIRNATSRKVLPIRIVQNPAYKIGSETKRAAGLAFPWPIRRLALDSSRSVMFQQGTIHHEIAHVLTFGKYNEWKQRWIALHQPLTNEPYSKTHEQQRPHDDSGQEYFLTAYASTDPFEDIAVCAEHIMVPILHIKFLQKIKNAKNPAAKRILQAKYNDIKDLYRELSGGKMNDDYWRAIVIEGLQKLKATGGRP